MLKLLDPYRWLIGGTLVALLVAGYFWHAAKLKEEGRQEIRAQVQAEAARQLEEARVKTANLQEIADEAVEQANKRAQANAAAASRARTELGRLRTEIARTPSVSGDSCTAAIDRAAALGTLLGECAERYSEVARAADAHANQALTLRQAWPELDDFAKQVSAFGERVAAME
jgi:DNA repair exonuclease SbcCD ATPase subunit